MALQSQFQQEQEYLIQQVKIHQETIRLMNLKRFGKSSEKDPGQCELFDEAEQLSEHSEEHDCPEDITEPSEPLTTVSKPKRGRKPLPDHLPRVVQEQDLEDSDKICDCGCQKTYIGDQVSE